MQELAQALASSSGREERAVSDELRRAASPALVADLIKALEGVIDDPFQGRDIAIVLGGIGAREAIPVLTRALCSEGPFPRSAAAWALGRLRSPEGVPGLLQALEKEPARYASELGHYPESESDPRIETRSHVAEALGRIGGEAATAALAGLLKDAFPGVRIKAAEALGGAGDAAAVEALLSVLGDRDHLLRLTVVDALCGAPDAEGPLLSILEDESDDPEVRLSAARSLSQIGAQSAAETLIAWLDGPRFGERCTALEALGRLRYEPAVARVAEFLEGASRRASEGGTVEAQMELRAAVKALAEIANADALATVLRYAQHSDPRVRAWVAFAVGRARDVSELQKATPVFMEDKEPFVRLHFIRGVENWDDPAVLELLASVVKEEEETRVLLEVVGVLGGYPGEPAQAILSDLADSSAAQEVREASRRKLEGIAGS
jgi:HEAT repeat protein